MNNKFSLQDKGVLILESLNESCKKYRTIPRLVLVILCLGIFFYDLLSNSSTINNRNLLTLFVNTVIVYSGWFSVGLLFYFAKLDSKEDLKKGYFLRKFILFEHRLFGYVDEEHIHDLVSLLIRANFSIIFYSFLMFAVTFIPRIWGFNWHSHSAFIVSVYLVMTAVLLIFLYGGIVLPRLISFKVKSVKYEYIYWMYFLKSRLVQSPIALFFSIVLFIMLSLTIIILPLIKLQDSKVFHWGMWNNIEIFPLLVTIISLWVTIFIIMVNDLLKNYVQLYKSYEEYSNYQLRHGLLNRPEIEEVLVGFGSLGRFVAGGMLIEATEKISKKEPETMAKGDSLLGILRCGIEWIMPRPGKFNPLELVEIIIDKELRIRIIPRTFVVIEQNSTFFEELKKDDSGLAYGFFSARDVILTTIPQPMLFDEHDQNGGDEMWAICGINWDGGTLHVLRFANIDGCKLIINTTSDPDMGYKLRRLVTRELRNQPVIITTCEDSSSHAFLESQEDAAVFAIHDGKSEGMSIGSRVFAHILNNDIRYYRIVLLGGGKSIYYTLDTLKRYLSIEFSQKEIKKLINKRLIILSEDNSFVNERLEKVNKKLKRKIRNNIEVSKWNFTTGDNEKYRPSIIRGNATIYSLIKAVYDQMELGVSNKQGAKWLFIVTNRNTFDTIRILQQIKQLISTHSINNSDILVSVPFEQKEDVEKILSSIQYYKGISEFKRTFPAIVDDYIMNKNLIMGGQIRSIRRCLNAKPLKSSIDTRPKVAEVTICFKNQPGAFMQILSELTKGRLKRGIHSDLIIPSFFYSYSLPVFTPYLHDNDTFIFRGDARLNKVNLSIETKCSDIIQGININCNREFRPDLISYLPESWKSKLDAPCNIFSQRCPISDKCRVKIDPSPNKTVNKNDNNDNYAQIKIWGANDTIPGSLTAALSNLLFASYLSDSEDKTIGKQRLNIVYESCHLCTQYDQALLRLYVQVIENSEEDSCLNNNLIACKIKPITGLAWEKYALNLHSYLGYYNWELEPSTNGILLFRKNLNKLQEHFVRHF